jgi:hypothetical protein
VLIFPRLAFVTLANNLMVLSIRSMLTEFFCEFRVPAAERGSSAVLMSVAVFCFGGFVYALFTLSAGRFELSQIGWWLLEVYFGLDASGFESARECAGGDPGHRGLELRRSRVSPVSWAAVDGVVRAVVEHAAVDGARGDPGEHFCDD